MKYTNIYYPLIKIIVKSFYFDALLSLPRKAGEGILTFRCFGRVSSQIF